MGKKIKPSWEEPRWKDDNVHSPKGIERLRNEVRFGLQKKYKGLAEMMWRWEFPEGFEDMQVMSQNLVPELFMLKNGKAVWFKDPDTEQFHCLPVVMDGGVNMYGRMVRWHPMPVGYTDRPDGKEAVGALTRIRNLRLDATNSVVMLNDLHGGNDEGFIDSMIDELVDNILTTNQLQLLAKCPYVFNVTEDNVTSAKNMYLAIATDSPAVFVNALGESVAPAVQLTGVKIDPALFEIFDRFECQILEYIGFPCVPITKRAQQTVSEVTENDDKIRIRRQEKLRMREFACEQMKKVFGIEVRVVSVIDEYEEEQMKMQMDTEGEYDDGAGTESE